MLPKEMGPWEAADLFLSYLAGPRQATGVAGTPDFLASRET